MESQSAFTLLFKVNFLLRQDNFNNTKVVLQRRIQIFKLFVLLFKLIVLLSLDYPLPLIHFGLKLHSEWMHGKSDSQGRVHLKKRLDLSGWLLKSPFSRFKKIESFNSQLTCPASQKSKDLNKVSLLLQDLDSDLRQCLLEEVFY